MSHTFSLKTVFLCLLILCLAAFGLPAATPARAETPGEDPVAAASALLEAIDSLQQMQNKRSEFTVSGA